MAPAIHIMSWPSSNVEILAMGCFTLAGSHASWCTVDSGYSRLRDSLAPLPCHVFSESGSVHGHCLVQESGYQRCQPIWLGWHLWGWVYERTLKPSSSVFSRKISLQFLSLNLFLQFFSVFVVRMDNTTTVAYIKCQHCLHSHVLHTLKTDPLLQYVLSPPEGNSHPEDPEHKCQPALQGCADIRGMDAALSGHGPVMSATAALWIDLFVSGENA